MAIGDDNPMNPFVLMLLAILTPFLLVTTLFVPPYAGIYAACYLIYNTGKKLNPLADRYSDVFYIIDVYNQLFHYWLKHMETLSFVHYTLPIVGLPLVCLAFALWLTRRIARKMKNLFHLGASA